MKHLKINDDLKNSGSYSKEGIALEGIGTIILGSIVGAITIWSLYDKNKKDKENKEAAENIKELFHNRADIVKKINETYLNRSWLSQQTFVLGEVPAAEISKVLAINGKMPQDIVKAANKMADDIVRYSDKVVSEYNAYCHKVNSVYDVLHKSLNGNESDEELYSTWSNIHKRLLDLDYPANKLWKLAPNSNTIPGGLYIDLHEKHDIYSDRRYHSEILRKLVTDTLPALTEKEISGAASAVIRLLSVPIRKTKSGADIDIGVFAGFRLDVYNPAQDYGPFDDIQDYEEAWDYGDGDREEDFHYTAPFRVGAMMEQDYDPYLNLDHLYRQILADVAKALIIWIDRSIKK